MKNFFQKIGGLGMFLLIFQVIVAPIMIGSLIKYNLENGFDIAGIFGYLIVLGFLIISTVWQYKNYIGFSKFEDGLMGKKKK